MDAASVTTPQDTDKTITLTGHDQDGDTLTFAIVSGPANGTLGTIGTATCSGSPWTCTAPVTYTPDVGYTGSDSFTFKANDGQMDSETATISITVFSTLPWADDVSHYYNWGGTVTITLTGGDPQGESLTFEIVDPPSLGTLGTVGLASCTSAIPSICSATVTYTRPAGSWDDDSFTYQAYNTDNIYSNIATVKLHAS